MKPNIYMYIFVMAGVTYLIRLLPLTLIRGEITNRFLRSFLYYVPYVTLSVMTFPAILTSTGNFISAFVGFIVALIMAFMRKSLIFVSLCSCLSVFLVELFTGF